MKIIALILILVLHNSTHGNISKNDNSKDRLVLTNQTIDTSTLNRLIANEDIRAPMLEDGDHIFYNFLLNNIEKQRYDRDLAVNKALKSKKALLKRQKYLRANFVKLLGEFPEKTPLNPIVIGKVDMGDYVIEKIAFESRPNYHITANLYLPKNIERPLPAVYIPCGHTSNGKGFEDYRKAAALYAVNGFVTLIADPIAQGERYQFLDENGKPLLRGSTTTHALLDGPAMLNGSDVLVYELFDNIRCIDYLESRPQVDKTKIGVSGNSGGGTQTTFLVCYDNRVKAAAPSCFIATSLKKFQTPGLGPGDGCQQLSNEGPLGIEEQDFLFMAAPTPVCILAGEKDYFPIEGAREAYADLKNMYTVLGIPEKAGMVSCNETHGFSKPLREGSVQWMRKWLMDDESPVIEPENLKYPSEKDILVTNTGQVGTYFDNETNMGVLNMEMFESKTAKREEYMLNNKKTVIKKVKELSGYHNPENISGEVVKTIKEDNIVVKKIFIKRSNGVDLPAILIIPETKGPELSAVILADEKGKTGELKKEGLILDALLQNKIVLSIDVSNYGELTDTAVITNTLYFNKEFRNGKMAYFSGSTALAYKTGDIISGFEYLSDLPEVNKKDISLTATGLLTPAAIIAALFEEDFSSLTLVNAITSWRKIMENPIGPDQLGNVVPDALNYFDLEDLLELINADKNIR